jgi:hypothetical protein
LIGLIKPNWLRGEGKDPGEKPMDEEDAPYTSIWRWLSPPLRWRDWQRRRYNQMRRRRAWRLFDAACASVRVLADHVRAQVAPLGEDAKPLAQELRSIRHTLDENALSCIAPSSAEALRELFNLAEETAEGIAPPANNLVSALDALRRALEAQRRTLTAWAPAGARAARPAAGSRLPPPLTPPLPPSLPPPDGGGPGDSDALSPPPEEAAEDQKLTRDEAAILAGLTEKFCKSWTFRIIGFALVAAALLAGGGTLFLGERTLSLRDDLEKTEQKGENEIKNSTKTLQESIDKQMVALSVANTEIQNKKDDFERQLNAGRERIAVEINNFTSKSDELQKQIADIVVQRLDSRLKVRRLRIFGQRDKLKANRSKGA